MLSSNSAAHSVKVQDGKLSETASGKENQTLSQQGIVLETPPSKTLVPSNHSSSKKRNLDRYLEDQIPEVKTTDFEQIFGSEPSATYWIRFWGIKFHALKNHNAQAHDYKEVIDMFIKLSAHDVIKQHLKSVAGMRSGEYLMMSANELYTKILSQPFDAFMALQHTIQSLYQLKRQMLLATLKLQYEKLAHQGPEHEIVETITAACGSLIETVFNESHHLAIAVPAVSLHHAAARMGACADSWLALEKKIIAIINDPGVEMPEAELEDICVDVCMIRVQAQQTYLAAMHLLKAIPAKDLNAADRALSYELSYKILNLMKPDDDALSSEEIPEGIETVHPFVTPHMLLAASLAPQPENALAVMSPSRSENNAQKMNFADIFGPTHPAQQLIKFWNTTLSNLEMQNPASKDYKNMVDMFIRLCTNLTVQEFLLGANAANYQKSIASTYLKLCEKMLMLKPAYKLAELQSAMIPFISSDQFEFARIAAAYTVNQSHIYHAKGEYEEEHAALFGAINIGIRQLSNIRFTDDYAQIINEITRECYLLSCSVAHEDKNMPLPTEHDARETAARLIVRANAWCKLAADLKSATDHPALNEEQIHGYINDIRNCAIALNLAAIKMFNQITASGEGLTKEDVEQLLHCTLQNQMLGQALSQREDEYGCDHEDDYENAYEEILARDPTLATVCKQTQAALAEINLRLLPFNTTVLNRAPVALSLDKPNSPASTTTREESELSPQHGNVDSPKLTSQI